MFFLTFSCLYFTTRQYYNCSNNGYSNSAYGISSKSSYFFISVSSPRPSETWVCSPVSSCAWVCSPVSPCATLWPHPAVTSPWTHIASCCCCCTLTQRPASCLSLECEGTMSVLNYCTVYPNSWLSGVESTKDVCVWMACIQYCASASHRDSVWHEDGGFLALVFTTGASHPVLLHCRVRCSNQYELGHTKIFPKVSCVS